ncbi:hypothetical protein [Streptomyces sp. NPDC005538]|uniref:hypothetical protein n=1 Tax=unclassified Streptomyces TaxID=2593676 RepID=UPI0033ACDA9E
MSPTTIHPRKGTDDPVNLSGRVPGRTDTRRELNTVAQPTGWDDLIDERDGVSSKLGDTTTTEVVATVKATR